MTSLIFAIQSQEMSADNQYQSMEMLVDALRDQLEALNNGSADLEGLDNMVNQAREVYERLVVIRHKAMESLADTPAEPEEPTESIPFSLGEEPAVEEKKVEEKKEEEPPADKKDENAPAVSPNQTSLIDAIEEMSALPEDKSLVEKFAESGEESLADRLVKAPIADLTKAISLNQKFVFINELFDGDGDKYKSAVEQLNNCTDVDEAMNVLSEMEEKTWNEADSVSEFRDLVHRRYIQTK